MWNEAELISQFYSKDIKVRSYVWKLNKFESVSLFLSKNMVGLVIAKQPVHSFPDRKSKLKLFWALTAIKL